MLDGAKPDAVFDHHLGHGIGLFPHEGPHLNPNTNWDDVFEVGNVFTAEPGPYAPYSKPASASSRTITLPPPTWDC